MLDSLAVVASLESLIAQAVLDFIPPNPQGAPV